MSDLPIVRRELLVRARRRSTYWIRASVGLGAGWIALTGMAVARSAGSPSQAAQTTFLGLAWTVLAFTVLEGLRQTADALSRERREGTLGLLFLSELTSGDVVLGKLAAAVLGVGFGALAFVPAMALPVLGGGVSGGEVARAALALSGNLLLVLASGLWASAGARDEAKALIRSIGFLAGFAVLPFLADLIVQGMRYDPGTVVFSLASPVYALQMALDSTFRTSPARYWGSLLCMSTVAVSLVIRAIQLTSNVWRGNGIELPAKRDGRRRGAKPACGGRHSLLLERDPSLWLATRESGGRGLVWAAVVVGFLSVAPNLLLAFTVRPGGAGLNPWLLVSLPSLFMLLASRLMIAAVATRGLVRGRRSGTLALLLTTPLADRELLGGYWRRLRSMIQLPLLVYVLLQACVAALWLALGARGTGWISPATVALGQVAMKTAGDVTDCIALCWVGMWLAVSIRNPGRATALSVAYVVVIPWIVLRFLPVGFLLLSVLGLSVQFYVMLFPALGLVKNLLFILWARRRLRTGFRAVVTDDLPFRRSMRESGRAVARLVAKARAWHAD